jgi:hypothetical protein
MITKIFEVRDRLTFISVLAIQMTPVAPGANLEGYDARRFLLRHCGWSEDGVMMVRVSDGRGCSDPYDWDDRTHCVAHVHINEKFDELLDGAVIDVEYVLGETDHPKVSERFETMETS